MKSPTDPGPRGSAPAPAPAKKDGKGASRPISLDINVSGVLSRMRAALGGWFARNYQATAVEVTDLRELCNQALLRQGEVSGMVLVAKLADAYQLMEEAEKAEFFAMLARDMAVDGSAVEAAAQAFIDGEEPRIAEITALKRALESPRMKLLRLLNTISGGIKFLMDMRADLLAMLHDRPELAGVEYDLKQLLSNWFNIGFLRLERLSWETPAEVLEKLIRYEAVHQITSWEDLKHRLTPPRTAFAFFHPAMPYEPLIFVEAAITNGLASNVQALLDPAQAGADGDDGETAIFYSISNAQTGLRGIPLGNFLIKQVLAKLRSEFPHLETFATLSPMPNFRRNFVEPALDEGRLARFFNKGEAAALREAMGEGNLDTALQATLGLTKWAENPVLADALRPGLLRAARAYLTEVRKPNGAAACPVAHFHASNGALLGRLNWLADTSPKGLRQSLGIMVNYVYDAKQFEEAQAAYVGKGELKTSKEVQGL